MMNVSRLVWLFGGGLGILISWYSYVHFCDTTLPQVQVLGLADGQHYAGDVCCTVTSNKNGAIAVLLDGESLPANCYAKSKSREYPFIIPTTTLGNGNHTIQMTFTDTTYHHNVVQSGYAFAVDNVPLQASFVQTDNNYKVDQGHTLHVQFQTNKPVKNASIHALSQAYNCIPESKGSCLYECFIPIACEEQPNAYILSLEVNDFVKNTVHLDRTFHVVEYPFKKQILRVDKEKVKHEQEEGPSEKEFEALLAQLTQASPPIKRWRGTFCAPTDIQRVTCEFGTMRITQHKGRYAHKAVDVINHPRSVVWAPQDGVVVIKDRFAASGNTVVLDHGCGIFSMVFHLEDFADIQIGELVLQGNPLGTLGETGFATGYHLHWEHRVNNVPVDPFEWTKTTF
jgi:hypothetical protein